MILYLDTSALVKLFVEEPHSDLVRTAAAQSALIVTHLVAYAEACSAFARLARLRADGTLFGRLRRALDVHWTQWEIVAVDEPLVRRAGEIAGRYRLRGYDSIHLAAAQAVHNTRRDDTDFRVAVFDVDLARAAKSAGLSLLES